MNPNPNPNDPKASGGYKSFARWPDGNITDDTHDTKEQAEAVCQRLCNEGLGGDGQQFPVKTWVEPVAPKSSREGEARCTCGAAERTHFYATASGHHASCPLSTQWDKNVSMGDLAAAPDVQPEGTRQCIVCGLATNTLFCKDAFCGANTAPLPAPTRQEGEGRLAQETLIDECLEILAIGVRGYEPVQACKDVLWRLEEIQSAPIAPPEPTDGQGGDIEAAARFFANAYIRGFRSAFTDRQETLTIDQWVEANWESFCTEAADFLTRAAMKGEGRE